MLYKCQGCDTDGRKTIDDGDPECNFIKAKNGRYHYNCYIEKLMKTKKMSKEDALIETERIKQTMQTVVEAESNKKRLQALLTEIYGQELPVYFCIKLAKITNGTYKKITSEKISYKELLEMYSNGKMINKLDKVAFGSSIDNADRLDWDLAVMFNEYPRYVKHKKKMLKGSEDLKEALENIRKYKIDPKDRFEATRRQTLETNKKSVSIDSLVDDILG